MSHTTRIGKTAFVHNGDFSGEVTVHELGKDGQTVNFADVPISDIEGFVAEKLRSKILTYLEGLDSENRWVQDLLHQTATRLGVY